jgi:hypothetical protein
MDKEFENSLEYSLILLAVQYRNDLKYPITNTDSVERRLEWIDKVLSMAEEDPKLKHHFSK